MTRASLKTLLLTGGIALLLVAPALAEDPPPGDPGAPGAPGSQPGTPGDPAPPAPSYLPTAPTPIADPNADEAAFARPRVAIIPFIETYSAEGVIVATGGIGEILATEMSKTGRFNIVAKKEQLKELIQNAQIEQSGLYDLSTVASLGNYKGAEYLFQGRVTGARLKANNTSILGFGGGGESATIRIDFALYKAETGEMVYSGNGEGTSKTTNMQFGGYGSTAGTGTAAGMFDGAISKACMDIVEHMVSETDLFPVRALVKGQTSDGKIYVDLGQNAGIYPGLKFDIREVITDTDMDTGEVLGFRYGNVIGAIVADQVQLDRTICRKTSGDCKRGFIAEVPKGTDLRHLDHGAADDAEDDRTDRDRDDDDD